MRISAVARAAGVSTRTVRFYHQLGVLPEPDRRSNGYRDYSFEDLTRLMRLRWLADSGLPLAAAGTGAGHDLLDDVEEALTGLRARREELARQEQLLADLRDNLLAGQRLSPLPADLNQLFEGLLQDASPAERQVLLLEREALETVALTGTDAELMDRYAAVLSAPDATTVLLPLLGRFGALRGADPEARAGEIRDLAAEVAARPAVAQLLAYAVADLPSSAFTGGEGTSEQQGPTVEDIVPDPAQRAVLVRLVQEVRA